MAKKPMGLAAGTPKQSNPIAKETVPNKAPAMPSPIKASPNGTAKLPGAQFAKLTRPAPMVPRTPRI